jgi:hypothetical protein
MTAEGTVGSPTCYTWHKKSCKQKDSPVKFTHVTFKYKNVNFSHFALGAGR